MKVDFAVGLSMALALAAQVPPADHVLDLVGYRLTPAPPSSRGVPPGAGGTASSGTKPNLRLTLLSLDRSDYQTGDPVIYEVLIQNVGTEPVELPWSPDYVLFEDFLFQPPQSPSPPLRRAILNLAVRDRLEARRLAWLQPEGLFGIESVAGSLEILRPRETAWMRVPSVWRTTDAERRAILSQPDGALRVHAEFYLVNDVLIVRSQNGIDVMVQSSLRPPNE